MTAEQIIVYIGFAILVVGAAATLLVQRGRSSVAETYKQLYEAKTAESDELRAALDREQKQCAADIAELRGRLAVLESSWVQSVASGVAEAVRDVMAGMEEHRATTNREEERHQRAQERP